jgi:lysozyme family protein
MADFEKAYRKTMGNEGGYTNDPKDLGGETYKGISKIYHPLWDGWDIINRAKQDSNFPYNLDENLELQHNVENFYKAKYWDVNRLDDVRDQTVAEELFDTGVNMGIGRAARFLQIALNYLNRNGVLFNELVVDGAIGPATLNALDIVLNDGDCDVLMSILNTLQGMHYMKSMDKNPIQKRFARGWFRRVKFCSCGE